MASPFRAGRVASVDATAHRVRVTFAESTTSDGEALESFDLPVLARGVDDYALPPAGAPVLCAIDDGDAGVGWVVGILYTDEDAPPLSDKGQRSIASDDLRLGDPAATDFVALASKVADELDKIKSAFNSHTHDFTGTTASGCTAGGASGTCTGATASGPVYTSASVAASKVKAK